MIPTLPNRLKSQGINPNTVYLLSAQNRKLVTGQSRSVLPGSMLGDRYGMSRQMLVILVGLLVFALFFDYAFQPFGDFDMGMTFYNYAFAFHVLTIGLVVWLAWMLYQQWCLTRLLPTAQFFKGTVTACSSGITGFGRFSHFQVTLDCTYCLTDGTIKTLRAVNHISNKQTALASAGEPVIVMILDKPIIVSGRRRQEFVL